MKRIAIKVGSNVLTRKDGTLDITRMSALTDQIAELHRRGIEVILVSSGAVASGRSEVHPDMELDSVAARQIFSAVGQAKLMNRYYDLFRSHGIACGQVLTTKSSLELPQHYENQKGCIESLLGCGIIPIVNENDTISITELMFTDNDELSGWMAQMMSCDMLVILSNIDGVYDGDPSSESSRLITEIRPGADDISGCIKDEKSSFGRGGMMTKCGVALRLASEGMPVVIANGKRDDVILRITDHDASLPCTRFVPFGPFPNRSPSTKTCIFMDRTDMNTKEILLKASEATGSLRMLSDETVAQVLLEVAEGLRSATETILAANAKDLARMSEDNPKYDRLKLTPDRISAIASDMENVAGLQSPLGHVLSETVRPNGMIIRKVSVPFGVVGVIYEARPNVTADVFSLCFRSGNVCVLKGGSDADDSSRAIVSVIHDVLQHHGIDTAVCTLLPADREATAELLGATGLVDVIIPRGSSSLINYVRDNARIPVIETGAGICHTYFDKAGDVQKGASIINNAKTRRVSVCNALDCLVIHKERLTDLPQLCSKLSESNVVIYADAGAFTALDGHYPSELLQPASPESFGTEFLDYKMSIRTVDSLQDAIRHIAKYSSKHSESIVSEDPEAVAIFKKVVDAACVYANVSTAFTDGAQFGFGAEIGISTQKLHARGPMALPELTTYKYIIEGDGQIRKS